MASISSRIDSTATRSDRWRSPKPMVLALAIAACSVTRMNPCSRPRTGFTTAPSRPAAAGAAADTGAASSRGARSGGLKAGMPVIASPRIRAWMSWVPS